MADFKFNAILFPKNEKEREYNRIIAYANKMIESGMIDSSYEELTQARLALEEEIFGAPYKDGIPDDLATSRD